MPQIEYVLVTNISRANMLFVLFRQGNVGILYYSNFQIQIVQYLNTPIGWIKQFFQS